MAKGFATGIALGTLTSPEHNSSFLLATYAVDLGVQFWFRPQVDIYANASEIYTAAVQVCLYVNIHVFMGSLCVHMCVHIYIYKCQFEYH
jgi:hypothetical protein